MTDTPELPGMPAPLPAPPAPELKLTGDVQFGTSWTLDLLAAVQKYPVEFKEICARVREGEMGYQFPDDVVGVFVHELIENSVDMLLHEDRNYDEKDENGTARYILSEEWADDPEINFKVTPEMTAAVEEFLGGWPTPE